MNKITKSTRESAGEIWGVDHLRGGIAEWWCSAAGGSRDAGARAVLETQLRDRDTIDGDEKSSGECVCVALVGERTTRERAACSGGWWWVVVRKRESGAVQWWWW